MNLVTVQKLRGAARLSLLLLLALQGGRSFGQSVPLYLPEVRVVATRTAAEAEALGTSYERVSVADARRFGRIAFGQLLGSATGLPVVTSGAPGSATSLFLRGANSNQTLFLIDGLRANDPNTDYAVFLGGYSPGGGDVVEIARGPQGALHGGEAVGGIVSLSSTRGSGPFSGRLAVEGGSFGTYSASLDLQGERDAWAYAGSLGEASTDNERSNNDITASSGNIRIDRSLGGRSGIGGTLRFLSTRGGDPGDRWTADPDDRRRERNRVGTLFLDLGGEGDWDGRAVAGFQDRRFEATVVTPGFPTTTTEVRNRRFVLDAQASYSGVDRHRVTGGFTLEAARTRSSGFGSIDSRQELAAFFIQDELALGESVFLSAGLRSDDFDTFGRSTTGRMTAAWLVADGYLKLRGSFGTAFRSPSFLDLYGTSSFYVGNPGLRPERARAADIGLDWQLPNSLGAVSASAFRIDTRDLIVGDFSVFPSTVLNAGRARTSGVELGARLVLGGRLTWHGSYTYLEARNLTGGVRLLRRPRHLYGSELTLGFTESVTAALGVSGYAGHEDIDARTFATVDGSKVLTYRASLSWVTATGADLLLRVENLFDAEVEPVNGYPALGRSVHAGLGWNW
jgi:vitamin B12 transporter